MSLEDRVTSLETRVTKLEGKPPIPPVPPQPPTTEGLPTPPTGSKNLKIIHVGANKYDQPHAPENVLVYVAADKEKRFAGQGIGTWLDMNFDKVYDVTGVDIAFYKGTERKAKIDIIDDENIKAVNIESDGQTEFQRFTFSPAIKTNRLKLVNQGNAQNDWMSIRAVSPFGKDTTQTPPDPICPSGSHWDQVQKKCIPDSVPSGNLDLAGIPMIYPTKQGGEEFTAADLSYKRSTHNQSNESNIPRDTFTISNSKAVDMELTFVGKIDGTKADDFSFKTRSKTHNDSAPKEGQCYSYGIGFDGEVHISKETPEHPTTPNFDGKAKLAPGVNENTIGNIRNRDILIKGILYNQGPNVKCEIWYALDPVDASGKLKTGLALKPYFTALDDGSWKNAPQLKLAASTQTIYMRVDHVDEKTVLYAFSAREIDADPKPVNRLFANTISGEMGILAFPGADETVSEKSRREGNTDLLKLLKDRSNVDQGICGDDQEEIKGAKSLKGDFDNKGQLTTKGKRNFGIKVSTGKTSEEKDETKKGKKRKGRKSTKKTKVSKPRRAKGPGKRTRKTSSVSREDLTTTERVYGTSDDKEVKDESSTVSREDDKEVLAKIDNDDVGKELSLLDDK